MPPKAALPASSPPHPDACLGQPLSLGAFLAALAARINRINDAAIEPVTIRAIPIRPATRKVYSGRVYCELRDVVGRDMMEASVAESQVDIMPWNVEVLVTGLISLRVGLNSKIGPEFRIDSARELGGGRQPAHQELEKRWEKAIGRTKRNIARALLPERPRVVVITGVTSVAIADIRAQLREAEEAIDLIVKGVSMTSPAEIALVVREATDANLIVLTRGGGHEVSAMDDDELIEAIVQTPTPTATALGHATNALVLDRVADHSFATPTACGVWLRTAIEQKRAHLRQVEETRVLQEARTFQERIQGLEETNRTLAQLAQHLEQEASARRETETRLLAQQQQMLQQLNSGRAREGAALQQAEQLATALHEAKAHLLAQQQRLLEQLEAARLREETFQQQIEQGRREAEQRSNEIEQILPTMRAADETLAELRKHVSTLQGTQEQGEREQTRLEQKLTSANQKATRAWKLLAGIALAAGVGWLLFLAALLFWR